MIGNEPSLSGEPTPGRDKGRSHTLAEYSLEELIARWEEFFSERGLESEIIGLADRYPEERSLKIRFEDLNRFDTDMSIHLLRQPLNVLTAGEEAIRRVVPPTEEPVEIHLRVLGVPRDSRIQIRDLRAKHLGRFIAVEGLVRKATEVRPMVVDALFQCLRCGTVIKEAQEGQAFREPMECYEDQGGCKRTANATKFKLLGEASRYTDTQKIEVQEAPEGLRGGEEPQRLSAFTEDDLTGKITPGMRVILNGILRSSQKGRPGQKSTLFDIMLDVNSTEFEQVEFEEIEVTPEDVKRIEAEAADPEIYRKIVASIAPSLYGLTTEKEALALQLFSGVAKEMPDGRRIRGDIHLLLVGDPGTGKSELLSYMSRLSPRGIYATGKAASAAGLCIAGESLVATRDGFRTIADVVEHEFTGNVRSRPLETRRARGEIATFAQDRRGVLKPLETVWRLRPPTALLEIETASGRKIRATPATKLLVDHAMAQSWIRAKFLRRGMRVATARKLEFRSGNPPMILDLLERIRTRISVAVKPELMTTIVDRLTERFGTIREAAARLLVAEDALYHQWRNGRHRIPLATLLRLAIAAEIPKERVAASIRDYSQAGGHAIRLPERLDADLSYFAGLIAGDGSVEDTPGGGFSIRFANSNPRLGTIFDSLVPRLFGVRPSFTPQSPQRSASRRFHSALVAAVLEKLGVPASPKSAEVTLPDIILNGHLDILAGFLRGLFDTDGTISVRDGGSSGVSLTTTSPRLAERAQIALLRFGIHARIRTRRVAGRRSTRSDGKPIVSRRDQFVLDIMDYPSARAFRDSIGFSHSDKAKALAGLPAKHSHSNRDLLGSMGPHLREVRRLLDLTRSEAYGVHEAAGRDIEGGDTTTHEMAQTLVESLGQAYREDRWEGFRLAVPSARRASIQGCLKSLNVSYAELSKALRISLDRAQEYFHRSRRPGVRIPVRVLERLATFLEETNPALAGELHLDVRPILHRIGLVPSRLVFLRTLSAADVRWEPIAAIRVVPFDGQTCVYDLTVRDAHAFVANGILVHNTAAAVRDEFGEGRWTLEAGALVLADRGLACIDELEKMNPQDRSAIHEAMEQQRVSVAKAGITAVLQARCAVLAAANPKFGRFDETKFVSEQLDLPPTLLSRFDVIFSLIDHPESERDRNMAEHILRGHLVGEWRRRRAEGKEVADENVEYIEAYSPHFEPTFFRKYVAYAKRFSPVMTPESMETIKAKYLEIRKAGEPAGASVPITPRQLEAIIRLAEASARARLSQRVDPEDADRAVRITEYWMRRVAGEEGRFDIDIVQVGISHSQRDQIITLRDVINQLSEQTPSGSADYEDIVRVAGERGIPQVKVDQWLKRWAQEGDVYTPGKNKYKLVERL